MNNKKIALVILDGWGIGDGSKADAISNSNTPVMKQLMANYPWNTLQTSGLSVGLPAGQMGNSEVGHLNIGAGRVIFQELVKINLACDNNSIASNRTLVNTLDYCLQNDKPLHLFGLLSNGCIHSNITHLFKLIDVAEQAGLTKIYVHAFTDGRDTDPKSGVGFIEQLLKHIENRPTKLASVIGRYYAMDRDKRWERVKLAYDLLVKGIGELSFNVLKTIENRYASGETDEFLKPIIVFDAQTTIKEGDAVISFNYRTDRCREITEVLTQKDFTEFEMYKLPIHYVTLTNYDDSYKNVQVIFQKDDLSETLGEVLSKNGKTQLRIAETEKYPHVTFFFSGGRELPFDGESRIMIASIKVATYDLMPEMSAQGITDAVIKDIEAHAPDFICLNYANADMVGHTGVYSAIQKAVETVDNCLGQLVQVALKYQYSLIIIADHGNSDMVINPDGTPNTAHTTNPVPCVVIDSDVHEVKAGKLADIAPTILTMMGIDLPKIINGDIIVA
jgi:2,3-bisphosphoglycerate-independent phosphoglycerate mutase